MKRRPLPSVFTREIFRDRRGSALMMAIFTVTVLLVIATEVVYQTSVEHLISAQGVNGVQAYYAAKAGAEISLLRIHIYRKAMAQFASALPNKSMLDPIWQIPFTWPPVIPKEASGVDKDQIDHAVKESGMKAQYIATIEPETGKIDVDDLASKSDVLAASVRQQLQQIMQDKIDSDEEFAAEYRGFDFNKLWDAIKFYVQASKEDSGGMLSAYGTRSNEFVPPHRPFRTLQELHLVPGMTDKIFDVLSPKITVFGAKGINVNYASKAVIRSLSPQITEDLAQRIVDARADPNRGPFKDINDFTTFLQQLGINADSLKSQKDPKTGQQLPTPLFFDYEMNFRIRSTGISGKVQREVTAIVYDFDRVKARYDSFAPKPSPTPAQPTAPGAPPSPSPTPAASPTPAPVKVPNERPNVVYWTES